MNFSKDNASRILSSCTLAPRTALIADYWLSGWDADGYPARASIAPSKIKPLLPGVVLFHVVPGQSVMVRMAGTNLYALLKTELTGKDWLAVTRREHRNARLSAFSAVARGSIALGRWTFPQENRRAIRCEKLLLPLRPALGADEIPVLGFIDWTPSATEDPDISLKTVPLPEIVGDPFSGASAPTVSADTLKKQGGPRAFDIK